MREMVLRFDFLFLPYFHASFFFNFFYAKSVLGAAFGGALRIVFRLEKRVSPLFLLFLRIVLFGRVVLCVCMVCECGVNVV